MTRLRYNRVVIFPTLRECRSILHKRYIQQEEQLLLFLREIVKHHKNNDRGTPAMKKLVLAAAIAATVSVGAQATTYTISSTVTGSQLFLGAFDDEISNSIVFGGTVNIDTLGGIGDAWTVAADQTGAAATLTGSQGVATGSVVNTYNLTGSSSAGGIVFDSGIIDVQAIGTPYYTVDASVNNLHFDNTGTYYGYPTGGIDMSGGTVNGDGTITIAFNGLWDGNIGLFDEVTAGLTGSGAVDVLYEPALIFLEGNLTLTAVSEVPVPAAAWLFGSALLGLAGIKRRK